MEKFTRREVLIMIGAAFGVGAITDRTGSFLAQEVSKEPSPHKILKTSLLDPERVQLEQEFLKEATNLHLVNLGFQITTNPDVRIKLLQKRWLIRQNSNQGLIPLSQELANWATEQKIDNNTQQSVKWPMHPEVLAICREAYPHAQRVITKLLEKSKPDFRPDLADMNPNVLSAVTAQDMMINAGGMAQLICAETGIKKAALWYGFTNIGRFPAITQLNLDLDPKAEENLQKIAANLQKDTNLPFSYLNIPGASRTSRNQDEGSIWLQLKPSNVTAIYELMASVNEVYNPADVISGAIGNWVFLARGQRVLVNNRPDYRFGYLRNYPQYIDRALAKWNPSPPEIEVVRNAAIDYYAKFLEGKPEVY